MIFEKCTGKLQEWDFMCKHMQVIVISFARLTDQDRNWGNLLPGSRVQDILKSFRLVYNWLCFSLWVQPDTVQKF